MNCVVSPGQDTALFSRNLTEFISGYAHIYLYDYKMLTILLKRCGFHSIEQRGFCQSYIADFKEPLHVEGLEPKWQDLNQEFYERNGLIHYYDDQDGKYHINFRITGFDRDPLTSLIVEAKKKKTINKSEFRSPKFTKKNYNRYGKSLLKDEQFALKWKVMSAISSVIDNSVKQ